MTLYRLLASAFLYTLSSMIFSVAVANAKDIQTNAVNMPKAPEWLTRIRVEKVTDRMQTKLEWTIRKIEVRWYTDKESFQRSHSLGPGVDAVTNKSTGIVHIGPDVTSADFDAVFGHELVHVILSQKYKSAIPPWIEEGLANHLAERNKVDYAWLVKQPFPADVRKLVHPFSATINSPRYHYQASHALAQMIAKKCDMENLLRLSVGRNMDDYLGTYCEIKDLNAEFKKWVQRNAA